MRVIVAVTGASGSALAKKVIEGLKGHDVHLITTKGAKKVAELEGVSVEDLQALAHKVWDDADMASPLASSSNRWEAMAIVPASMKTMAQLACGLSDNLVVRAADNVLKTGGKLVVCPRDTPLTLSAIENMRAIKLGGAHIVPPNMAYYYKPDTIDDATSFFAGKVLDCLGIDHSLYPRWGEEEAL